MKRNHILFIDWDGTLCWSRFWESLRFSDSSEYELGRKIEHIIFSKDRALLNNWMRGQIRSEQVNMYLSEQLQVDPEKLWNIFVQDCKMMRFDDQFRVKIEQVKTWSYVILATGNMDCFMRFTVPALGLEDVFDKIICSSDLGYLKTENDGETFLMCSRAFNIPLGNTYLIDDSEKTCNFFSMIGGHALAVRNGKTDTLQYLDDLFHHLRKKSISYKL